MRFKLKIDKHYIKAEFEEEHEIIELLNSVAAILHQYGVEKGFEKIFEATEEKEEKEE